MLLSLGRMRESAEVRDDLLDLAIEEVSVGLQEIREIASGLHPSVLSERGLRAALEAGALRAPLPVEVNVQSPLELPTQFEATAYYVVAEGLANVHKHAGAKRVVVQVHTAGPLLRIEVTDDGVGGADVDGLRGLADRVEALGGRLTLTSPAGTGTRLLAEIPLAEA